MRFFETVISFFFLFFVLFPLLFVATLVIGYFIFDSWYFRESVYLSVIETFMVLFGGDEVE